MRRSDAALVALRRILRATEEHRRSVARESGLTPVQLRVMGLLASEVHSTQKALAGQLRVSQATVSVLIDRLEAKGLVRRDRSDRDRRQTDLTLTDSGAAAVQSAPDPLHDRFVERFEALEDFEQASIIAALERVAHLLDASGIDAAALLDLGDIRRP